MPRPLGSSASRTPSRRKPAHALALVIALLAGCALLTLGLVGADLWRDARRGSHRADRWFPWTYPLLSRWAGDHQEFALTALERRGYPYSLEALEHRLDAGWQPPRGWFSATRWLQFGLLDEGVLVATVDRLGTRAVEQAAPVLSEMASVLDGPWLSLYRPTFALRVIHTAELRQDEQWLRFLPYRLDPATAECARAAELRLAARVGGESYERLEEIKQGLTGDPLVDLEDPRRLLHLVAECYAEQPCAQALRRAFSAHWGRDALGLEAGCLLLRHHDDFPREKLRQLTLAAVTKAGLHPVLLEDLALGLPDSRLARGCREYSAIRGEGYFRDYLGPRFDRELAPKLTRAIAGARAEEKSWRRWLERYPDHPGADDARWWLARSLEWQGRRCEALEVVACQLTSPLGDSACRDPRCEADERVGSCFEDRFRWLLDVGTTEEDLARFLRQHPRHPLRTQVRYALAIRHARAHDYREALRLTAGMRLVLRHSEESLEYDPWLATLTLEEQRKRWRQLARHDLKTHWGRLAVTGSWTKDDGWRNGYLLLYKGSRHERMTYWYPSEADPTGRPDEKIIRQNYRDANPNFVACQLLQDESADALFYRTLALYKQWTMYPLEESTYAGGDEAWFLNEAERAAERLTKLHPQDRRGAVAWWHCYNISPKTRHLQAVIAHYPAQAGWARELMPDEALHWWDRWF